VAIQLVHGGAVSVMVADLDRAVRFYVDALGFAVARRDPGRAELRLDGMTVALTAGGDPGWRAGRAFPISLAFDVDRLEGAMQVLRERGARFAPEIAEGETERIAFFTDEDGTPMYLRERKAAGG
jgi:catechol 2,3-dioxygenase-like lactoylglutathione lyase family enzyme